MPNTFPVVKVPDLGKMMKLKGATTLRLADIAGVSHSTVSRAMEGGNIFPDLAVSILTSLIIYDFKNSVYYGKEKK